MRPNLIYFVIKDKVLRHTIEYVFINEKNIDVSTYKNTRECFLALNVKPDLVAVELVDERYIDKGLTAHEIIKLYTHLDSSTRLIVISEDEHLTERLKLNGIIKYGFVLKDNFFLDKLFSVIEQDLKIYSP
jgi:hypothetical protein